MAGVSSPINKYITHGSIPPARNFASPSPGIEPSYPQNRSLGGSQYWPGHTAEDKSRVRCHLQLITVYNCQSQWPISVEVAHSLGLFERWDYWFEFCMDLCPLSCAFCCPSSVGVLQWADFPIKEILPQVLTLNLNISENQEAKKQGKPNETHYNLHFLPDMIRVVKWRCTT